jgi:hypothetical protein
MDTPTHGLPADTLILSRYKTGRYRNIHWQLLSHLFLVLRYHRFGRVVGLKITGSRTFIIHKNIYANYIGISPELLHHICRTCPWIFHDYITFTINGNNSEWKRYMLTWSTFSDKSIHILGYLA